MAFDLSLTATGVADENGWMTIRPKVRGMERLRIIRGEVEKRIRGAQLVVLEGYSFGLRGSAVTQLGELGGVVRLALFDAGVPFVDVPPSNVKKYAAGKGNADKTAVLVAARERLGYAGLDHNEADALWLLEMARDRYGLIDPRVPKANREALNKIEWPKP